MGNKVGGFNQKLITIHKTPINMKEDAFLSSRRDVYKAAMLDLNGNSFKLWIYLEDNKDQYSKALSTKHISEECGMSARTAQNCVNDLIEKGYLVLTDAELNEYFFYDVPVPQEQTIIES
jgi:DNA replication protein DnaD